MVSINCWECSTEISDHAMSCPHCGAPLQEKQPQRIYREENRKLGPAAKFVGLAMLALGLFMVSSLTIPGIIIAIVGLFLTWSAE
jgi:zinc-ribbon domain